MVAVHPIVHVAEDQYVHVAENDSKEIPASENEDCIECILTSLLSLEIHSDSVHIYPEPANNLNQFNNIQVRSCTEYDFSLRAPPVLHS